MKKEFDPTNKDLKNDWLFRGVVLGSVLTLLVTLIAVTIIDNKNFLTRKDVNEINMYANYIKDNYLEDVDKEQIKQDMIKGMFSSLDIYSEFYNEEDLKKQAEHDADFVGIGVRVSERAYDSRVIILNVMEDSPAEEAGLKANDVLVKIDGQSLNGKHLDDLTDMIRGKEGTTVDITVLRGDETLTFTATRKPIENIDIFQEKLTSETDYIQLYSFGDRSATKFNEMIDSLDKKKLIIDLRNNGGGEVDAMMKMLNHLSTSKENELVFYTVDGKNNKTEYKIKHGSNVKDMSDVKIVILVNENTASCSEIFSSYMKENGYATIIGSTTYGKGVVQEYMSLNNGTAVKLTTAEYFTSKGNKINEIGVTPDVESYNDDETLELALLALKDSETEKLVAERNKTPEEKVKETEVGKDEVLYTDIKFPKVGEKYADLKIKSLGIDTTITTGSIQAIVDANDVVISGRGGFCGSESPIVLAGHNNKSFRNLSDIQEGDIIEINTSYGNYFYKVLSLSTGVVNDENTNIVDDEGNELLEFEGSKEYLYAYTCLGDTASTNKRWVVKAEKIQGTKILY